MNIDELFKIPSIASGRNKRKMPATPDVQFLDQYNAANEAGPASDGPSSSKKRNVTFAEEDEVNIVPEEDYEFNDDDEEGRFFGGGLTEEQNKSLEYVDAYEDEEMEEMTEASVKKMVLKFERTINKNQEQRIRYADQPEKFMESEADLDEELKNLLGLTQAPHLYPILVNLKSATSIVSLLSHENIDIVIDAIDLINELTDEDVGMGENEEERKEATDGIQTLVGAFLENELPTLLVHTLDRLDESEETDRQGIFKILGIYENILALEPQLSESIVLHTDLMPWLLKRIKTKTFDSNRGYASEILSILLQENKVIRRKLAELDGVDILLQCLAPYKRKDPADEDETEMVVNLFNALCSVLSEDEARRRFLESEGIELMLIMLKERTLGRIRAVKVLSFAMNGTVGKDMCHRFVEASGLKTLFPLFMGKGSKKLKKSHKLFNEQEDEEHIMCILLSLMRYLPHDDIARLRLLQKFTESDYEKVDRLIEMKEFYEERDQRVRREIEEEKKELEEEDLEELQEEFDIRRLDAGLYTLQRVCLVVAVLSIEMDKPGIKEHTLLLLQRKGQDMAHILSVLEEEPVLLKDFLELKRVALGESESATAETKEGKVDGEKI